MCECKKKQFDIHFIVDDYGELDTREVPGYIFSQWPMQSIPFQSSVTLMAWQSRNSPMMPQNRSYKYQIPKDGLLRVANSNRDHVPLLSSFVKSESEDMSHSQNNQVVNAPPKAIDRWAGMGLWKGPGRHPRQHLRDVYNNG
jgi:hypothetical protein